MAASCRLLRVPLTSIPLALALAAVPTCRDLRWADLSPGSRILATQLGITNPNLSSKLAGIDSRTSQRLRDGEFDHLVFYVLQSQSFTSLPPIEPARSNESSAEPRIAAYLRTLDHPQGDRQQYFATLLQGPNPGEVLRREYRRAMRFLYEKEVRCRETSHPQTCIADLYQNRGHSSDTSSQAMIAVRAGLDWIRRQPASIPIRKVLIVGPGVDFAPRTHLREDGPPQVFQPGAVRKSLRTLGLAAGDSTVDCVDINPRVLRYAKAVCSSVYPLNVVTQTLDLPDTARYDLIIATNVLLYMSDAELLLAITSVHSMLRPGGYFLHNDARFAAKVFGDASGLPAVKFGDVIIDHSRRPALTDRFVIHRSHPHAP